MEVNSGEMIDGNTPSTTSKVTKSQKSSQTIVPQETELISPLSKSRYGRTRKPKISEDFYDIDVIFEATREPKKSPQIKSPLKNAKLQLTKSPKKPKDDSQKAVKTPKSTSKSTSFAHVTGDTLTISENAPLSSPNSKVQPSLNTEIVRKFFKREPNTVVRTLEADIFADVVEDVGYNTQLDAIVISDVRSLNEDSLNMQAIDVTKVLKIVTTNSPDLLQECSELKAGFKPALKTYGNKRRSLQKMAVVESFALPDKPIFPIENDPSVTSNEPKRIKKLDVAEPSSEDDINIVDKKLLNTPWKIANISADFNKSEDLLEFCVDPLFEYEDKITDTAETFDSTETQEFGFFQEAYANNDNSKLNTTKNLTQESPQTQKQATLDNISVDILKTLPQNEVIILNDEVLEEYKYDVHEEFLGDIEISSENCEVNAEEEAIHQESTFISDISVIELKSDENKMSNTRSSRGRSKQTFEVVNKTNSTLKTLHVELKINEKDNQSAELKTVKCKSITKHNLEATVNVSEKYDDSVSEEDKTQADRKLTETSSKKQKLSVVELPASDKKLGLSNTLTPEKLSKTCVVKKQKYSLSPSKIINLQPTVKLTLLQKPSQEPQRKSERLKMGSLTNLDKNPKTDIELSKTGEGLHEINLLEKTEFSDKVDEELSLELERISKADSNVEHFKEIHNYCMTEKLPEINLLERENSQLLSPPEANTTAECRQSRSPLCVSKTPTGKDGENLIFSDETSELAVVKTETELEQQKGAKTVAAAVQQNFEETYDEVKPALRKSYSSHVKMEPEEVQLGDLMWAKVGQHPYWPSVVTKDPLTSEYFKSTFLRGNVQTLHHMKFFGDRGRRAWVNSSLLIRFTDKNNLQDLYEQSKNKLYVVKRHVRPKWDTAVAEADSLTSSTVQERFEFFFNMFASEFKRQEKLEKKSEPKRCRTPKPSKPEPFCRKRSNSESAVKLTRSKSLQALVDSEEETLLAKKENFALQCIENVVENIPSIPQVTTNEKVTTSKSPKKGFCKLGTKNQLETSIQKRALKLKKRREKNENIDDESEFFVKSPRQARGMRNMRISTPVHEFNSEYYLSDTDSVLKSNTNTPEPDTYKLYMARQKRNNLFRGVSREKVCQVCKQYGDILKCKGPCNGTFHYDCAYAELDKKTSGRKKKRLHKSESFNSVPKKRTHMKGKRESNLCNETPDTTILEKNKNDANVNETNNDEIELLNEIPTSSSKKDDIVEQDLGKSIEAANTSSKVEIIYVDCDESDFEHTLTPKARLTPAIDFSRYSLVEQIDMKMQEVMQQLGKTTRYADSTTDYTSSEDSSSNLLPSVQKPNNSQKKIDNVTTDHISASNISLDDFIGEDASTSTREEIVETNTHRVTSTGNSKSNMRKNGAPENGAVDYLNCNIKDDFKCKYCISDTDPPCFVCSKEVSSKNDSFRQKCSLHKCGKFYHLDCVKIWPQTQWSLISRAKHKHSGRCFDTFVCPVHVCHTCASDNPHAAISRCTSDKIVKCLQCPATYHTSNYCVPAGTVILSTSQIVCTRHLSRKNSKGMHRKYSGTVNTAWCFICAKGGDLICCETCPTSVHTDCVEVNLMEDGTFICEDCETGRLPLYDEIVWVKLGYFRWWPALILFPNEIPANIKKLNNYQGEFVVKFYGSHDHYWVNSGRVFSFQEDDRAHSNSKKNKVDAVFKKSIIEAAAALRFRKVFEASKEAELRTGMKMKPPPYIRVKVNKPVGNVRLFDGNISNTTSCECNPNQEKPCGPDSVCLNRLLLTECDSNICPAKENCHNQRFERRQYPNMEPFKTPGRGWGLKTLQPISKGDFVIEYVGEIIDENEYQRRIRKMHEQKDENYYFLTIDKDRIIDAGPKGNFARFMNHCCQPNCETQKWTVNGDTRVGLFAVEDIPEDKELTFNYNLECIGKEKKVCKCGAPNCSGFIGVKAKMDESQKKPKKSSSFKKRKPLPPQPVFKNDGPCFICGEYGDVGACQNKMCSKFYHMKCVNLQNWPEGKWVCPWHNCNICSKRTIRCCVKCINSYCPVHSEGNVRYNKLQGFICSEHDPAMQSQVPPDQSVMILRNSVTSTNTEETDVTSTTSDEINNHLPNEFHNGLDDGAHAAASADLLFTKAVTSTPIKTKTMNFENSELQDNLLNIPQKPINGANLVGLTLKRKRGRPPKSAESLAKRIKLADVIPTEAVAKPTPSFVTASFLDISVQNEVKLSPSIPTRHLRTTRNNVGSCADLQRFLNRQNELEKDLPMRKRSRPRCEASL